MSTIQIVGIAVAAVVVVLLIVALVVTRKGGDADADEQIAAGETGSFLDSAPSDTLAKLGRAEHVPEPAPPATGEADLPEGVVMTATGVAAGSLSAEIWPEEEDDGEVAGWVIADETETTGEIPVVAAEAGAGGDAVAPGDDEPAVPAAGDEAAPADSEDAAGDAAGEPGPEGAAGEEASGSLVPLSSIIVTTSTKMVDLEDPEIRRMLTDLVTFEIDQATQFREAGQSLDAVLQLTEAEKICRALGKEDTAREIRDMMRGLQA